MHRITPLLLGLAAVATQAAHAADTPPALRDPWVPPAVQASAAAAAASHQPTRGAALQAQVDRKLRAAFDRADTAHTGRITREQARAAGLGHIDQAFEQIDASHTGTVSFEDVQRYLAGMARR